MTATGLSLQTVPTTDRRMTSTNRGFYRHVLAKPSMPGQRTGLEGHACGRSCGLLCVKGLRGGCRWALRRACLLRLFCVHSWISAALGGRGLFPPCINKKILGGVLPKL